MSEPSPLRALFYFCLLLVLLAAGAWHYWGPPPAGHFAQVQPAPADVSAPANPPAPADVPAPAAAPVPVAANVPLSPVVIHAPPAPVAVPAPAPRSGVDPAAAAAADFARRVTESQQVAVTVYPALGNASTEINARFVARYRALQAEHSARLQDPNWPLLLADECAAAAGIRVVSSAQRAAPPAASVSGPAAAAPPAPTANAAANLPAALRAPAPAAAPESGSAPLISLNVTPLNGGGTYNGHWLTFYNGYDLQGKMNRALDLDARNLSAHPSQVVLQWIFTAHKHARGSRAIFDMGSKTWDMQPNESTHFGVRSADLSNRAVWYYEYGYGRYSGSEFDGWLVVARYKDKVLKAVGSSGSLEALVDTPEFATLVSAYQGAHPGGGPPSPGTVSSR